MLQSLSIQNFRQFRALKINGLRRINLIVGKNNAGKTALLEALYLLFGQGNAMQAFPSVFRNAHGSSIDDFESFWRWLPYQRDAENALTVLAMAHDEIFKVSSVPNSSNETVVFNYYYSDQRLGELAIYKNKRGDVAAVRDWPPISVFSTRPSTPAEDAEQFNRIAAKRGGRQKLTALLQALEPNLYELQYLKLGTQPLVYADVGLNDLTPITQLGQGFVRLLRIFAEALLAEAKIILIDEVENGIGYRAQTQLWQGLAENAQQEDLQVFATTHSYECIQAAHEVFSTSAEYDFAVHRLERTAEGDMRVVTYDHETLAAALDLNFEVR